MVYDKKAIKLLVFSVLIIGIILLLANNGKVEEKTQFVYGVAVHPSHYTGTNAVIGANTLQQLGVSMVRDDFGWGNIEKSKGVYDFSYYDSAINTLTPKNISTLAILGYGNALYENIPQDVKDFNANSSNRFKRNYMPIDDAEFEILKKAYGNYVYQTVLHYKGKIKYFELFNEPYVQSFWYPSPDPAKYAQLLQEGYIRAKQANPDVIIVANAGYTGNNYLQTFYQYGGKDYFDILSVHPYCSPNDTLNYSQCGGMKAVFEIRKIMDLYGDNNKQIWFTEMGYPSTACSQTGTNCNAKNSLDGQVIYLNHSIQAIQRDMPWVTGFFWYDFKNDCADSWSECNFGLTYQNYTGKPAFYEYQRIINGSQKN